MDNLVRKNFLRNCNTFPYIKIYNPVPIIVSYVDYAFQQPFCMYLLMLELRLNLQSPLLTLQTACQIPSAIC